MDRCRYLNRLRLNSAPYIIEDFINYFRKLNLLPLVIIHAFYPLKTFSNVFVNALVVALTETELFALQELVSRMLSSNLIIRCRLFTTNLLPLNDNIIYVPISVTRKKSPNVYKSCPKLISLEK